MKSILISLIVTCILGGIQARLHPIVPDLRVADAIDANQFERIINGYTATNAQFPYFVNIIGTLPTGATTLCGGALISANWVITAAHCLTNVGTATIGMGSILLNQPQVQMVSPARIIHPNYNAVTFANDVALLSLPINVTFTNTIQAIRLPAQNQAGATFLNATATLTGFGRVNDTSNVSQYLRYVRTRVISNAECSTFFGTTVVQATTMCTLGYEFNLQGPCANDNGGPLAITETGNINTLVGLVSFISSAGCSAGHPAGYIRIASFLTWISQNTGIPLRPS